MVEFHVDAHRSFQEEMNTSATPFGGKRSVRKPTDSKMIISIGHDEAIFNKHAFSSKCWSGADGETPIRPKGDGEGIMTSALQSRDVGFGFMTLTDEQLETINKLHEGT